MAAVATRQQVVAAAVDLALLENDKRKGDFPVLAGSRLDRRTVR